MTNLDYPCTCGHALFIHYPFDGTKLENLEQWCGRCYDCGPFGYRADNLKYLEMLTNVKL